MTSPIVIAAVAAAELQPAPIAPGWIISGAPQARNKILAASADTTSYVMVWECTPGRFNWHYTEDESLIIVSGEVFITDAGGERRMGPGDMGFFPAGSSCVWRVTSLVRKVAVLRSALPPPVALGLKAWSKLLRLVGIN